jgi:hypothetical protein
LYQRLRRVPCESLWQNEVPTFNQASPRERTANVALIRAIGVTAACQASPELKSAIRLWLRGLLKDPEEKIRRYAINALPKVEPGPEEESALIELLRNSTSTREQEAAQEVLSIIGSGTTLQALASNTAPSSTPSFNESKPPSPVSRRRVRSVWIVHWQICRA